MTTATLPKITLDSDGKHVQVLRATLDDDVVGELRWNPGDADGAAQLLHVEVDGDHRRGGVGSALLQCMLRDARQSEIDAGRSLRRAWCVARHKRDVIFRAWLTRHGFQHSSTVADLFGDEDGLVYVRTFD